MKKVFIDNSRRMVLVDGKKVPRLLLGIIRGAIGKRFVVKHYKGKKKGRKIVVTRYPDMSGIVASEKQRVRRDLFKEAVVYAKWIIADAERKQAFRKTLPKKKQGKVYQAAIQLYMRMGGKLAISNWQLAKEKRRWAIGNKQGGWKGVKGEGSMVKDYREPGPWRVIWQKNVDGMGECWKVLEKWMVVWACCGFRAKVN